MVILVSMVMGSTKASNFLMTVPCMIKVTQFMSHLEEGRD
jgi:hypothetical protein